MTVCELAERLEEHELDFWVVEDYLRDEERRDAMLEARAKAAVKRA